MSVRELRVEIRLSVQPWTGRSDDQITDGKMWGLVSVRMGAGACFDTYRGGGQTGGGVW